MGSKYSGLEALAPKRLREFHDENSRLKKMYAEMVLENPAIKGLLENLKQFDRCWAAG